MSLLSVSDVSFTWGGPNLLDGIDLEIDKGERIGLLGRNGCGKSTLMQLLAGEVSPDNGEIKLANGVQISRLVQEVPLGFDGHVAEFVAASYVDSADDWQVEQAVKRVLSRMKLDGELSFATLSSGMKRRVLLAQALVSSPVT